jgi:hypothetical protein
MLCGLLALGGLPMTMLVGGALLLAGGVCFLAYCLERDKASRS